MKKLGVDFEDIKLLNDTQQFGLPSNYVGERPSSSPHPGSIALVSTNGNWPSSLDRPYSAVSSLISDPKDRPAIDRILSGPISTHFTEKRPPELKKSNVPLRRKEVRNKLAKSIRPRSPNVVHSSKFQSDKNIPHSRMEKIAKSIFFDDKKISNTSNIQKLTYAEKLQIMIMQVQDAADEI